VLPQHLVEVGIFVTGERPDGDFVPLFPDVGEIGDAADVDERRWLGQPQLHQGQKRMAAGEELGVLSEPPEELDGMVRRIGHLVLERGGNHAPPP
jgi:hypothetical protein